MSRDIDNGLQVMTRRQPARVILRAALVMLLTVTASLAVGVDDSGPHVNGTRVEGVLLGNNVWTAAGSPYWIESNVSVPGGSELTIEAGVSILVNGNFNLTSSGGLRILGTSVDPVVFSTNSTSIQWWRGIFESYGSFFGEHFRIFDGGLSLTHLTSSWVNDLHIKSPISSPEFNDVDDLTIRDLVIEHTSTAGSAISISGAKHLDLERFRISGGGVLVNGIAMNVGDCSNCTITNGRIESFSAGGLYCFDIVDSLISELSIIGASQALQVNSGGRNRILANTIADAIYAISLDSSSDNIVMNNTILSPSVGVNVRGTFSYTSHNLAAGNLIRDAASAGISFTYSSTNPPLSDNNIAAFNTIESSAIGLDILSSSHAIYNNDVIGNGIGARVTGSSSRMFHNHFTDNIVQAQDTGSANVWDDGYPSGGNWWSDYTCVDQYRGQNQNIAGSDGIGDTPYVIDPDSQDRYPFCTSLLPPPRHVTAIANQSSGDVILQWDPSIPQLTGMYYVYTSSTPTGFTFFFPSATVTAPATSWIDAGAANQPGPMYYIVRAYNSTSKMISPTSNTAGKWSKSFQAGTQTFSPPLARYPWVDYSLPGWDDTVTDFVTSTAASSITYMDSGSWMSVPGSGDPSLQVQIGEGYVINMPIQTLYTFTGLPASMISYEDSPPLPYAGFGQLPSHFIRATVQDDDVIVSWMQPPGMTPAKDSYRVYYSSKRDGFFGLKGWNYLLLNGAPVTSPSTPEASATHAGALSSSKEWYYMVVPYLDGMLQGSGSYSIGVFKCRLPGGYSAMGLPLLPYDNGTYISLLASSLSRPEILGTQWLNLSRGDWVARQAWMPSGMYDAQLEMGMAVQIDATVLTSVVFTGV